jgi:hypothetical protein
VSGTTTSKSWSGSITKGTTITFKYDKDGSTNMYDDKCTFSNMVCTYTGQTITGYESKSVARKIRKAYIGIGGVARPCWGSGDELAYYGSITPLKEARYYMAAASVGDYALFAGGHNGTSIVTTVDAYNKSLTHSLPTVLNNNTYQHAAASVGNYALFAGGRNGSTASYALSKVNAYNSSLTRSNPTSMSTSRNWLTAASVGNYALFAAGYNTSAARVTNVDAYNTSLTRSSATALSTANYLMTGVGFGNYAIFAGGNENIVNAYNTSLTRSILDTLPEKSSSAASASISDEYAIIAGGTYLASVHNYVTAYNKSLTKITAPQLSVARQVLSGASLGNYAIFAGGSPYNQSSGYDTVDVYDKSLTRTNPANLTTARFWMASTTIGEYALFAGGVVSSAPYNTVDAFKLI